VKRSARSSASAASWAFASVSDRRGATSLSALLGRQVVLPLVEVDDGAQAVSVARALLDNGLPVIEIALRTAGAMEAVDAVRSSVPDVIVGVGTVLSPDQLAGAVTTGAAFAVSPGSSDELLTAASGLAIPFVPGFATATELMRVTAFGIREAKFFPARSAGGAAAVSAFRSVAPSVRLLPTGGIDATSATDYLALDNVFAVGGSWVCPRALVRLGSWTAIGELARAASLLTGHAWT
jgi:2-dehydro-3-deoxyphosphogluconate aldolase/(4S)-4-hydroxy-2-oxoglutarate aldolase